MVGAAPGEGGWQEERIWCIICEGRASAKGCFTAGCGRVCIKKVATIGPFNKHLMGSIHALCVLVCAHGGVPWSDTACPCGSVLSGNASVLQCAGKKES